MKINIQMKPAEGTTFQGSNFVWSIQQFFKICKSHDKEFRILPWNIDNQNDETIKSSSLTDYKQIPEQKEAFEEYGYNIHVSLHRLSLTLVISTSHATFEKMFKNSAKINGEKQSILRQFRQRNVWVSKNDLSTMGTTKFVGFLCYAHPYLTNQYKLVNDLRKITNIPDLTVEHYNPKIFTNATGQEKGKLLSSTVAYCVGAPADISVDVMQMIVEKWQSVRKGKYAQLLGPTSNIHKFLFIPMSKVLMSDENRAIHMKNNNNFRYSYNGISLNKTRSVDIPFELSEEESKEIGYGEEYKGEKVTIRTIINSWVSPDDERQMVWMIEPANENRQVLVIKEQSMEAVRREISALFELLKKRPDFKDIVGNIEAHVDGFQAHTPEAKEYMEVLQETLVQVDRNKKEEYPALSPTKSNIERPIRQQRKNKIFNPYAKRNFKQRAQYADVIHRKEREMEQIETTTSNTSEKTNTNSTVSSLTNSTEVSNKQEVIRHPNQLKKNKINNENKEILHSTRLVQKTASIHNKSTTSTALISNDSRSNEIVQYTEREQSLLQYIEEQGKRLQLLETKQEETMMAMKESQKIQNKKIEDTINAKMQPNNEKLESISMSINNMKAKTENSQNTMDKLDARFDKLDSRLEKMLSMYEAMAQIQTTNMITNKMQEEIGYQHRIPQTQEMNEKEEKTKTSDPNERNREKTIMQEEQVIQNTERRALWGASPSPQPKTPSKKIEKIQESKSGKSITTLNKSPTTDEKGQERGEKRQKTPNSKQPNNQKITTKVKQEMIEEVTRATFKDIALNQGFTMATSIPIEETEESEGWITMGKKNTPKKKEEKKIKKKSTILSPVVTRSNKRSSIANMTFKDGHGNTVSRQSPGRKKSPKRRTATTQATNTVIARGAQNDTRRGQVGMRGNK